LAHEVAHHIDDGAAKELTQAPALCFREDAGKRLFEDRLGLFRDVLAFDRSSQEELQAFRVALLSLRLRLAAFLPGTLEEVRPGRLGDIEKTANRVGEDLVDGDLLAATFAFNEDEEVIVGVLPGAFQGIAVRRVLALFGRYRRHLREWRAEGGGGSAYG